MKPLCLSSIASLIFAVLVAPCPAQENKVDVITENDIVYGNVGDEKLMLDLALPKKGEKPYPVIVCIHGGGWKAGKRQDLSILTKFFANQGFASATISYRLAPKHKFPAQIEDCKAAIRFLRANAKKYNLDPERIGVIGFSAGGHLACLLGAADKEAGLEGNGGNPQHSTRVQAVVSFFGPTEFSEKTTDPNLERVYLVPFLGDTLKNAPQVHRKASPIIYCTKDDPPFLFFHGDKDTLVDIYHSKAMFEKLKEVGVPARLEVVEGAGHGWTGLQLVRSLNQTLDFFREKLKK